MCLHCISYRQTADRKSVAPETLPVCMCVCVCVWVTCQIPESVCVCNCCRARKAKGKEGEHNSKVQGSVKSASAPPWQQQSSALTRTHTHLHWLGESTLAQFNLNCSSTCNAVFVHNFLWLLIFCARLRMSPKLLLSFMVACPTSHLSALSHKHTHTHERDRRTRTVECNLHLVCQLFGSVRLA